jgi:hypothetical protein
MNQVSYISNRFIPPHKAPYRLFNHLKLTFMQTSQSSFKKSIWLMLPLAITAFSLFSVSSCNEKKDKKDEKASFDQSCMTLTKGQINTNWVPKYTDPKKPENERISVLKFYTNYDPKTNGYNVSVQAFNKSDTKLGDLINLNEGVACAVNLPSLVFGRSNDIKLSALDIFKADGTLKDDFVKIILTPAIYKADKFEFLKYELAFIIGDTRTAATSPERSTRTERSQTPSSRRG